MKLYQSVEEDKHSTTPYNTQYIQSMWDQKWFPPSIYRICQEIALDGRYSDFYEWMNVTLESVQDALSVTKSRYWCIKIKVVCIPPRHTH